jgi:hypothetical protein
VAAKIVGSVATAVTRTELNVARNRPPANLTAYELTLQGRELW